ncbi:hypothetical protein AAIA72_06195 [Hahella sp. SMD15-11]|uniref:Uncharacterized protein n=1 Tax=Thermohahella caldifontis TaxID=3142973 RepID=A0AB39UZ58_9GAMM
MKRMTLLATLFSALLLTACGGGSEAVDGARNISTGKTGSGDTIEGGTESNKPDSSINPNEVVVRVEATSGMTARALSAGSATTAPSISVVRLDREGNEHADVVQGSDYSVRINSDNTYTITFPDGIPNRLDLVVKATFTDGSGTVLRRALPNSNQGILINAATEHAVRRFFSTRTFPDQSTFDALLPCGTLEKDCHESNDPRPALWQGLNDAVTDFEISFEDSADLNTILSALDDNALFTRYEDQYFNAIKADIIKGNTLSEISQALEVPTVLQNRGGTYNAVSFALEATAFTDDTPSTGVGDRYGDPAQLESDITTWQYPRVILSNLGIASIPTVLTEDVPILRDVLKESVGGSAELIVENSDSEHNSQFAGNTFMFLNTGGFWEFGRRQTQTITRKNDPIPQGWLQNPFFSHLYSAQAQKAMVGVMLANTQNYNLQYNADKKTYSRLNKARDIYTFGWDVYLRQSDEDTETTDDDFTLARLDSGNGQAKYGALYFEQTLSASSNPRAGYASGVEIWTSGPISGSSVTLSRSQPNAFYTTISLSRDSSHVVSGPASTVTTSPGNLTASLAETLIYDKDTQTNIDRPVGRLMLSDAVGAASPDGSLLAATDASDSSTRRFWVAVKLPASHTVKDFAGQTWELHGNFVLLDSGQHCFGQTDGATLTFDSSGLATLNWGEIRVCETANSGQLTAPVRETFTQTPSALPATEGAADTNVPQAFSLSLSDPAGGSDTFGLKGFVADQGVEGSDKADLMVLRLEYGNRLGLIFATRRQSLTPDSP